MALAADESVADTVTPPLLTLAALAVVASPPAAVLEPASKLSPITLVPETSPEAATVAAAVVAASDVPAARQVLQRFLPGKGGGPAE